MEKSITLRNKKVAYTLRKSERARRMRLAVYCDGSVIVTTPHDLRETIAERFIAEKATWLFSKLAFFKQFEGGPIARHKPQDYFKYKEESLALVQKKVGDLAKKHGYGYNRISVKNQKTCWGSCSRKGNLNFNYKILFLPERTQDYIIVHELCHLREFNHSDRFWRLVSRAMPDHTKIRQELRRSSINFY